MKNKIFLISSLALSLVFVSGCTYGGTSNQQAAPMIPVQNVTPSTTSTEITPVIATITISGFAFNPATLTVKKGTTVTWTNNDSVPHQIKSDSFNSDLLSKGQSYSMTFNDAGIFNYSCTIHPSMTGQLIVQ